MYTWSGLTWVAYAKAFVAGGVIEGPVQVDFVIGAGDAQWAGVVSTEGNQERALSGWPWERETERDTIIKKNPSLQDLVQKNMSANTFISTGSSK